MKLVIITQIELSGKVHIMMSSCTDSSFGKRQAVRQYENIAFFFFWITWFSSDKSAVFNHFNAIRNSKDIIKTEILQSKLPNN